MEREGEGNPEDQTMTGMLSISDIPAFVLFDTGASHSFVSDALKKNLKLECKSPTNLDVRVPTGENITIRSLTKNVELVLNEHKMVADLYVIGMREFDIILGMD